MNSIILRFAEFNRSIGQSLERAMPRSFAKLGESTTCVPKLIEMATPYTPRGDAAILEVGGIDRPLFERGAGFYT